MVYFASSAPPSIYGVCAFVFGLLGSIDFVMRRDGGLDRLQPYRNTLRGYGRTRIEFRYPFLKPLNYRPSVTRQNLEA